MDTAIRKKGPVMAATEGPTKGFVLDTNVVSEMVSNTPEPRVIEFFANHYNLWISAIVIHELDYGLSILPQGQRRAKLSEALSTFIAGYADRILPVERSVAEQAARFRAKARRSGRTLHIADALIAGTAQVHQLAVATRDVKDFGGLEVAITNPWDRN